MVRLTDRSDMMIAGYHGHKATTQQQQQSQPNLLLQQMRNSVFTSSVSPNSLSKYDGGQVSTGTTCVTLTAVIRDAKRCN